MFRKLALSLLLTASTIAYSGISFATTYVWDGIISSYTLTSADSLFIPSGTFTGTITDFPAGARITIADIATFQPSSFPNTNGNSARGIMYNYGYFTFNTTFVSNTDFTLHNYGIVTLGNTTLRGSNQTWTNYEGGIINFTSDVLMNGDPGDNNHIINHSTVNCSGNFQMNSGSAFTNYKDLTVSGNFRVNGGTLINEGKLEVTGNILMNNGASIIRNYCKLIASGGITNTSGNFYNYSYVWAKNSDISNSSNIINAVSNYSVPVIHGRNFTQSNGSTMTGPALLYFYGTTTMSSGATMGVSGVTADTIKMYDVTRTQPTQIFDVQTGGTRYPNVIYNAWGVPDSTRVWLMSCSMEIYHTIPLAINWNYFYVTLSDKIPVLNWSANYQEGTVFYIQRSYDGRSFTSVIQLPAEVGRSQYSYNDNSVNSNLPTAYYRILAIEPGGNAKITQIRNVRFNNKPGSLHIFPNPFVNNFIVDYIARENEDIIIKIFNAAGQQKLVKKISVHKGTNTVSINEAANFSKGVYIVQVSNRSSIISSAKIIRQ